MKKLLCPLFALLIVLSLSTAAFAADYSAEESANALYELGLFQGTGETANGKPIYSLNAAPTRAQAVTMLVRLLGKEVEAKAGTWTVPFSDLADWARPYVGYAYANGLTNGLSAERFGSDDKVTANQYLTFILRALGYSSERDFQWDKANAFSNFLGLTHGEYRASRSFTRGDTARISFAALAQARLVQRHRNDDIDRRRWSRGSERCESFGAPGLTRIFEAQDRFAHRLCIRKESDVTGEIFWPVPAGVADWCA